MGPALRLSLILCSRNDAYCGDSVRRLTVTLNHAASVLDRQGDRGQNAEIVLADWGSEVPLADVLELSPAARDLLRIHHLPKERTERFNSSFSEVHALNAAARASGGDWIGRIDQDTLIGTRFVDWFFSDAVTAACASFSGRRDMTAEQSQDCARGTLEYVAARGEQIPLFGSPSTTSEDDWWRSAVGILLIPRTTFFDLGGYDETNIHYNHMEHEFIARLRRVVDVRNIGPELGYDFYHQFHPTRGSFKENRCLAERDLRKIELRPNGETWGLLARPLRANVAALGSQSLLRISGVGSRLLRQGRRILGGLRLRASRMWPVRRQEAGTGSRR